LAGVDRACELERGRDACARRAWSDAFRSLSAADALDPLRAADLERLATSAYLVGRDGEFLKALDRAHRAYLDSSEPVRAARCAFWIGLVSLFRGDTGPATGWLARAERLLDQGKRDCAERGYVRLPIAERRLAQGDAAGAHATATDALKIGETFRDADLIACALHLQGRSRIQQGKLEKGLALLDEAMVAVAAGELSPLMTGLLYCSVIDVCRKVCALDRAREWTSALARWCDGQPQLVAFTGTCLVHRAEILRLQGDWPGAILEARRACARFSCGIDPRPSGAALYEEGEVHRLRGDRVAAERAYRSANEAGFEPQPGLALLRLAEGRTDAAVTAIRRALDATTDRLQRARLLPAGVEILLAAGDLRGARAACRELEATAESFDGGAMGAIAAQARGAFELAKGEARRALVALHRARETWQKVEAPYVTARVRVLIALACRALGDDEGCRLELDAARATFERLGALPDLVHIDELGRDTTASRHGLTPRQLQVLRLVAAGKTNRVIAAELFLSEKTIDRHVSNIFDKLDVPSRAAATAFACQHKLI
jgi:DNA-binding CsgD family transcriptional regulator